MKRSMSVILLSLFAMFTFAGFAVAQSANNASGGQMEVPVENLLVLGPTAGGTVVLGLDNRGRFIAVINEPIFCSTGFKDCSGFPAGPNSAPLIVPLTTTNQRVVKQQVEKALKALVFRTKHVDLAPPQIIITGLTLEPLRQPVLPCRPVFPPGIPTSCDGSTN